MKRILGILAVALAMMVVCSVLQTQAIAADQPADLATEGLAVAVKAQMLMPPDTAHFRVAIGVLTNQKVEVSATAMTFASPREFRQRQMFEAQVAAPHAVISTAVS